MQKTDIIIVGAGPAGLSAAIYGSTEGFDVTMLEKNTKPGGQAAQSALIENYPGFDSGIDGAQLLDYFAGQARKFGTHIHYNADVVSIAEGVGHHIVKTADGNEYAAKMIVLAPGLAYKELPAPGVARLLGHGVDYGSPSMPPLSMGSCTICIVGGANSAGQAAMDLARNPEARIKMLVRRPIEAQMSDYLVQRIKASANIEVMTGVEVVEANGKNALHSIMVRTEGGAVRPIPTDHLCIFIGAVPKTEWLRGVVALDERGFIKTGPLDLRTDEWILKRPPLMFETSMYGVFAAGDVRLGSYKRLGASVTEGGGAIISCHAYYDWLEKGMLKR